VGGKDILGGRRVIHNTRSPFPGEGKKDYRKSRKKPLRKETYSFCSERRGRKGGSTARLLHHTHEEKELTWTKGERGNIRRHWKNSMDFLFTGGGNITYKISVSPGIHPEVGSRGRKEKRRETSIRGKRRERGAPFILSKSKKGPNYDGASKKKTQKMANCTVFGLRRQGGEG